MSLIKPKASCTDLMRLYIVHIQDLM